MQITKKFFFFFYNLLEIGRPFPNSVFKIHDPLGIKFLIRLRLGLSHLKEHKFRHNFQDCLNPLCSCSLEVESTIHFFLDSHYLNQYCQTLLDSVEMIANDISNVRDDTLVNFLLYGKLTYNFEENTKIIKASINNILNAERLLGPLM